MVTTRPISYEEIREHDAVLQEYAAECSVPAVGEIDPQWPMYAAMQQTGSLLCFGVYVDGAYAGFATLLLYVLPHYGKKVAAVESLFVSRSYRSTLAAAKLLRAIEVAANEAGCAAVLYSAPHGGALEGVLGKRYARTSSVFCKPLGQFACAHGEGAAG